MIRDLASKTIKTPINWLGRRHPLWFVLPFLVSIAAGTFPSREGFVAAGVATLLFFLCLVGWRINIDPPPRQDAAQQDKTV